MREVISLDVVVRRLGIMSNEWMNWLHFRRVGMELSRHPAGLGHGLYFDVDGSSRGGL